MIFKMSNLNLTYLCPYHNIKTEFSHNDFNTLQMNSFTNANDTFISLNCYCRIILFSGDGFRIDISNGENFIYNFYFDGVNSKYSFCSISHDCSFFLKKKSYPFCQESLDYFSNDVYQYYTNLNLL